MSRSICVIATNDEPQFPHCLAAFDKAGIGANDHIHLLVNGKSEDLITLARAFSYADPRVTVHRLTIIDKAYALNAYVHHLAHPDSKGHLFIDADYAPARKAFTWLTETLSANPAAMMVGQISSHTEPSTRETIKPGIFALSSNCVTAFRQRKVAIPVGLKNIERFIAYVVGNHIANRSEPSTVLATIHQEVLENTSTVGIADICRDFIAQSHRHFQDRLLYPELAKKGLEAIPDRIEDLYSNEAMTDLQPRRSVLHYIFDLYALQKIRAAV